MDGITKVSAVIASLLILSECTLSKPGRSLPRVVATTSWTAAYAAAAGVTDVHLLAPIEMAHPAEYELRPSDVAALQQADLIVYAGYEVMMQQIRSGLEIPESKLIAVHTQYSYNRIKDDVMKIASTLGTDSVAKENLQRIKVLFDEGREKLDGLRGEFVIAQSHTVAFLQELGIEPGEVFGPAAPEAAALAASAKQKVTLIIDNYHNPIGKVFRELHPNARYVQLVNFPGYDGTKTLADVIQRNIRHINN